MADRRLLLAIIPFVAATGLGGCSTMQSIGSWVEPPDGAPAYPVDLASIPDAEPRLEPFSVTGNPGSYVVDDRRYFVLSSNAGFVQRGLASWYGTKFHGKRTSSGDPYDMFAMTAAHKTLPIPTYVEVRNLSNERTIIVKINDRGPFKDDRIIDLSYVAAAKLGIIGHGTAAVELRAIDPVAYQEEKQRQLAAATPPQGALYLQVGAFSDRNNAERLRLDLSDSSGRPVHIVPGQDQDRVVYRVRIGPVGTTSEADALLQQLVAIGIEKPRIVSD